MNELEKILVLVQELELDMIEKGHISDDCVYTDNFGKIKELLYKESIK
jgi:hypothetical protein